MIFYEDFTSCVECWLLGWGGGHKGHLFPLAFLFNFGIKKGKGGMGQHTYIHTNV